MIIRKNTKPFKTILEIFTQCQTRADREKLVRLYITRAGQSIKDRIHVEGIEGDAAVFYEMNYQTIMTKLTSTGHQLHLSDEILGIYFFRSSPSSMWDETPFEFDESVKAVFKNFPELPVVRKKENATKFSLATATETKRETPVKGKKVKEEPKPLMKIHRDEDDQPGYKLKHKIHFTDLTKIVFSHSRVPKKDVLDYYDEVASYMLPLMDDKAVSVATYSKGSRNEYQAFDDFDEETSKWPDWIQKAPLNKTLAKDSLVAGSKDHLMFYAEHGALEFATLQSPAAFPDYMVVGLDSSDHELGKTSDVAHAFRTILTGLNLPSFVKTDGGSGLHVYIPLDSKSKVSIVVKAAEFLCKLLCLKAPAQTVLKSDDEYSFDKVSLDYHINEEGRAVIAPYSFVAGSSPVIATPIHWDDIKEDFRPEDLSYKVVLERLKKSGDPFKTFSKKTVNADKLLDKLEENYAFLF